MSGEPVEVRLPYGQPYTMREYGKLLFNSNELPTEVEYTAAFFRRLLIVPFNHTIPAAEQNSQLAADIIASELSGVFNWVLRGLQRLLEQGCFTKCAAATQQLEDYKSHSDTVRSFLNDNGYVSHPDRRVTRKALYDEYKTYCQEEGNHLVNSRNFGKRLENCGIQGARHGKGYVHFLTQSFAQ